ncbi:MAG: hypothetical protein ABJP48_05175 [Erythrobacter sp.]
MAEIVLKTKRLELRQIGAGDLDGHLEHLNTPAVMAMLGGPRTREQLAEKHEASREGFAKIAGGWGLQKRLYAL